LASLLNGIAVVRHVPTVTSAGIPNKEGAVQRLEFELSLALVEAGVYALQSQLGLTVHVGGRAALELQGRAHFVPLGRKQILLVSDTQERLPNWFSQYDCGGVEGIPVIRVGLQAYLATSVASLSFRRSS
jgi:hypothetical protein